MVVDAQGNRVVNREVVPEHGISRRRCSALSAASSYLYLELWKSMQSWGSTEIATGETARGLRQLSRPRHADRRTAGSRRASRVSRIVRSQPLGGTDRTGKAIPRAAKRSQRRAGEGLLAVGAQDDADADSEDLVACGVMNWRALYVTALNCPPSHEVEEEARNSETDVPAGKLPARQTAPPHGRRWSRSAICCSPRTRTGVRSAGRRSASTRWEPCA